MNKKNNSRLMQKGSKAVMPSNKESTLHARLDKAAKQLDAGEGVPLEKVRGMVNKWASR
jgi:hypothetical protein